MERGEGDPSAQIRYKRWPYIQVLERLIHKQLASYFYDCITCSVNHNPVLKECTQPTAVTYFVDEILTNMEKDLVTAGTVFFDLAKSNNNNNNNNFIWVSNHSSRARVLY